MGCVQSSEARKDSTVDLLAPEHASASHRRRRIYNDQRQDIKILLLGTRDSGKSTILKQMKLAYEGDFTFDEREVYKEIVLANLLDSMKAVIRALPELNLRISYENRFRTSAVLDAFSYNTTLSPGVGEAIRVLSKDPVIKKALLRSNEFQLLDNASYFFESADRICSAKFLPTNQDILRSSVTTTGISKTVFTVDRLILNVFDFGGSRSERRKWVNCFGEIDVMIFVASMSEYNQNLYEDHSQNRINESITLFTVVSQSRWFVNTSIILLLNKFDLFAENLLRSPLENHFPEFKGGQNYDAACDFIQNSFTARRRPNQTLYTHIICATDPTSVQPVLNAMDETIRTKYLQESYAL